MKGFIRSASVLGLVLLAGVAAAFAQTITSQLTGTVTTGGSPLPGATVTISSPQMRGTPCPSCMFRGRAGSHQRE
jgi:hypothetical protein